MVVHWTNPKQTDLTIPRAVVPSKKVGLRVWRVQAYLPRRYDLFALGNSI